MLPVLIYVIIHANPPNMLSTIDFIENFTPKGMTGQVMKQHTPHDTQQLHTASAVICAGTPKPRPPPPHLPH